MNQQEISDNYNKPFPTRLCLLLDGGSAHGKVTQATLASAIKTTRQAVSSYANGDTVPDIHKLKGIAIYFDVSADYLLGLIENKKNENADIGSRTGLSDEAIDFFAKLKSGDAVMYLPALNKLVEDKHFEDILKYVFLVMHPESINNNAVGIDKLKGLYRFFAIDEFRYALDSITGYKGDDIPI